MNLTTTLRLTLSFGLTSLAAIASTTALAQTRPSIAGLQAQITALQSQVTSGSIPNVAGYVTMDISNSSRPTLRVAGANLQIVNGTGSTDSTKNGLGNLIVGYDEVRAGGNPVCSDGYYTDQPTCQSHGGTWAVSHKSGSHNIVVGPEQNYSQTGGLVAGFENTINGASASVSGGIGNTASHSFASVSGGGNNTASGEGASVSGGDTNTASGDDASVSGGDTNTASGYLASVSGGAERSAPNVDNWVAGELFQPD